MIGVSIEPRQFTVGRDAQLWVRFSNTGSSSCTDVRFTLGLPTGFLLLRGKKRVEIPEMAAGQAHSHEVIVRPQVAGTFTIISANFVYRDVYNKPFRDPGFRAEVSVWPGPPAPSGPPVLVSHADGVLRPGEWGILQLKVANATDSPLRDLLLTIGGEIRSHETGSQAFLPALAPRTERQLSFLVLPKAGGRLPVTASVTYIDEIGRARMQKGLVTVPVSLQEGKVVRAGAGGGTRRRDTVLYLSANPMDLPLLQSDKEMREVDEQLRASRFRDRFRLEHRAAVRLKDVGQALADLNPRIVHFSGHGEPDGSVYLEDELRNSKLTSPGGLAALFGLHGEAVHCVIVNACHTLHLGEAMAEHINHVIVMRCEIGDESAILFSTGFYQGLGAGTQVREAFRRGCAFLEAQPPGYPEHDVPVLLERRPLAVS